MSSPSGGGMSFGQIEEIFRWGRHRQGGRSTSDVGRSIEAPRRALEASEWRTTDMAS
jgi:hypothetical protein